MKTKYATPQALLIALLALTLGACGGSDEGSSQPAPSAASDTMDSAADAADTAMDAMEEAADEAMDTMAEAVDAAEDAMADAAEGAMAAAPSAAGGSCDLAVEVGDTIAWGTTSLSVPSSCSSVTVTLTHTGQFPKNAMGHNWVLIPADALEAVATAGMAAGIDNNYVADDDRIIAATKLIGGGESDSVTFSLDGMDAGSSYAYVCTFPGHWSIMRGTFTIEG